MYVCVVWCVHVVCIHGIYVRVCGVMCVCVSVCVRVYCMQHVIVKQCVYNI